MEENNSKPDNEPNNAKSNARQNDKPDEKKGNVVFTPGFRASVEEIIGRTGTRGEALQVRCKVLDGRDTNKVLRRNVRGPVKIGDILMLRETEFEAQKLNSRRR